jgi:hypothetical protein
MWRRYGISVNRKDVPELKTEGEIMVRNRLGL